MGSAFSSTSRQVGAALGFAAAVSLLGAPGRADAQAAFERTWAILTGVILLSGLVMLLFYRRPVTAPEPDVPIIPGTSPARVRGVAT